MMRSSYCSAMASRLQLVPPPGAFLRVAGEASLRALDDPGGDAAVRLDGPQEAELLRIRLVPSHRQRLSILMSRLRGITRSRICRRVGSSIIRCTRPLCASAISWFSIFSFSSGYASSIRPSRSLASGVKICRRICCRWACCCSRYWCSAAACTCACCSSAIFRRRIASSSSSSIDIGSRASGVLRQLGVRLREVHQDLVGEGIEELAALCADRPAFLLRLREQAQRLELLHRLPRDRPRAASRVI